MTGGPCGRHRGSKKGAPCLETPVKGPAGPLYAYRRKVVRLILPILYSCLTARSFLFTLRSALFSMNSRICFRISSLVITAHLLPGKLKRAPAGPSLLSIVLWMLSRVVR